MYYQDMPCMEEKKNLLHLPKKATLIGRIADIVQSGRGPGFVS